MTNNSLLDEQNRGTKAADFIKNHFYVCEACLQYSEPESVKTRQAPSADAKLTNKINRLEDKK
jgi:hypothetical protein